MADVVTNKERWASKREKQLARAEASLAGSGRFIYENVTQSEQHLPKPAEGGKRVIEPRGTFVGDTSFSSMCPDQFKIVQVLEAPVSGEKRQQPIERAENVAESVVKERVQVVPVEQKKEQPRLQRKTILVMHPLTSVQVEIVLPPKWKRGDDVWLIDHTGKEEKHNVLFVFRNKEPMLRFLVPKSFRFGDPKSHAQFDEMKKTARDSLVEALTAVVVERRPQDLLDTD